jgi:hypothetical protein
MSKISVKVVKSDRAPGLMGPGGDIILEVSVHDSSIIGRSAKLTITRQVTVKQSDPINKDDKIERSFILRQSKIEIPISRKHLVLFAYAGEKIDIKVNVNLTVDTGLLFDTKINIDAKMDFAPRKLVASGDAAAIIEPKDQFSFMKNMKAIPSSAQMVVIYLGVLAGLFLCVNTIIGVHDQWVPDAMTWVYSQRNHKGESQSPIWNAMYYNIAAATAAWFAIRRELRRYMSFRLTSKLSMFAPGAKFQVKELISGVPRVPLESAELRIVACNLEKGSYWEKSGKNRSEETFSHPVRAITLYKKKVFKLPAGQEINVHFPEVISFDGIYQKLYPAQMLTKTHGIDLYWEVQLLSDTFVDQELIGPVDSFRYIYFFGENRKKDDDLGVIDLDPKDKKDVA